MPERVLEWEGLTALQGGGDDLTLAQFSDIRELGKLFARKRLRLRGTSTVAKGARAAYKGEDSDRRGLAPMTDVLVKALCSRLGGRGSGRLELQTLQLPCGSRARGEGISCGRGSSCDYPTLMLANKKKWKRASIYLRLHRFMCFLAWGPPPTRSKRTVALHTCGKKRCLAPACLKWGTQKENLAMEKPHKAKRCGLVLAVRLFHGSLKGRE